MYLRSPTYIISKSLRPLQRTPICCRSQLHSPSFSIWRPAQFVRFNSSSSRPTNPTFVRPYPHDSIAQLGLEPHLGSFPSRTHAISELTSDLVGQQVVVAGWLLTTRKGRADISFHTLLDHESSAIQVVLGPHSSAMCTSHTASSQIRIPSILDVPVESVILVSGTLASKPPSKNQSAQSEHEVHVLPDLEIKVDKWILLNAANKELPFRPNDLKHLANEDLRAENRFLDLRRKELAQNIRKRSKVAHIVRQYFHALDFTEIETPMLLQSSPEGAREYLVPTRICTSSPLPTPSTSTLLSDALLSSMPATSLTLAHSPSSSNPTIAPPKFYALPQSPQQPKQLIIASGLTDKYFQIAKCFRDEGGRKDRQPEFTQIDLEMGFISGGAEHLSDGSYRGNWPIGGQEIRRVVEGLMGRIWNEVAGIDVLGKEGEFKVMSYLEAMERFGSDKPDVRFGLECQSLELFLTEQARGLLAGCSLKVDFLVQPSSFGPKELVSKADIPPEVEFLKIGSRMQSTVVPGLDISCEGRLATSLGLTKGEIIWLGQRNSYLDGGSTPLGRLRLQLMTVAVNRGLLTLPAAPHFLWITEFPLFTLSDEDKDILAHGRYSATHHPFTAPVSSDLAALKMGKVQGVRGQHYDLVLNGMEVGGGSVRIHDARLQEWIMREVLKLTDDEVARFAHLLKALSFGAPPHGGMALGFDRLVSILCETCSIKDVIAFPKMNSGVDPVFRSPNTLPDGQLDEYGLVEASRTKM